MTLECVLCGHELRDPAHHVDGTRDVGHSPLPEVSSNRYTRQPVEVPAHTGSGEVYTAWDAAWRDVVKR
jgi:hypothetical protein